jgi:4-aminobutyrate aminotransferase
MQIDLVLSKLVHPDDLAAILVEPVLGEGGYFVPPPDFMLGLRQIADDTGALLITDEVQTGLGRTGMWFGVDHSGVTPDVMILSKALGGGLPLGGILGKAELMDRWLTGSHGSTYGGNPVCCRSGIESIRIIEDEDLVDRARIIGDRIRNRLQAAGLPQVGPVRGLGLMLAVEVHDDDGQMASPAAVNQFVRDLATAGVITTVCGKQYVRISPPLILDEALADEGVDRMLEVLAASGVH